MKKVFIPILLIVGALTMGANKCDPNTGGADVTKINYTFQVYAADVKCGCKVENPKDWNFATNLLSVDYGFRIGDGTHAITTEHGEPTPFSREAKGMPRAIQAHVSAQAADPTVRLLCVVLENGLALTPIAGVGSCSLDEDLL